jgi:hypothetical protein
VPYVNHWNINNVLIGQGDILLLNKLGVKNGIGPVLNEEFRVIYVMKSVGSPVCLFGLEGTIRRDERNNLDGKCRPYRGITMRSDQILDFFQPSTGTKYVKGDYVFGKKNLKGMKCKVVSEIAADRQNIFVEFEENIRGCCSDGLGKSGHCLLIDRSLLCDKIEEVEKKKEKKKKKKSKGKSRKLRNVKKKTK